MTITIAFLGLGLMGEPMARNLLRGGYALRVWNRTTSRAGALAKEGAVPAGSPAEACRDAEFAVVMVADPRALEAVLRDPGRALQSLRSGSVLINMGTQDIGQVEGIADEAGGRAIDFLDAPVTGSRNGAIEGTLTILVGGDVAVLKRARPVLSRMGKTILHLGEAGDGTRAKLVLNLIQAGMLAAWAEGLSLAKRLGLSPAKVLQVLEHSAGNAALFRYKGPYLMRRDFSTNFSLRLMDKDIKLALGEAERLGVDLPASRTVSSLFTAAMEAGLSEEDFLALAKIAERSAGTVLEP